MDKTTDIAIIGGGIASMAAALELEKSGLEVTLIRKAPGAAALSSGAWDLAGNPFRQRGDPWDAFPTLYENIREITRRQEFHPYSVFSKNFSGDDLIHFIKEATRKAAKALPLSLRGDLEKNMAVVTEFGTVKPTAMVQESMRQADLSSMKRSKVVLVSFKGFPNFNGRFIAQSLEEMQLKQNQSFIEGVGHLEASLPNAISTSSLSAMEIAAHLDREENFVEFSHELVGNIRGNVYSHIFLPPVMGLKNTEAIMEALHKLTGLQVAETLATPLSVPGWRLSESIIKYFQSKEYDVLEGEVVGFDSEQRKVTSLRIHSGDQRIKLNARNFILASGKYLGGGITRRGQFKETVFGFPLVYQNKLLRDQTVKRMSRTDSFESQPFFSAGIRINPRAQPLNLDGDIVYENLFAAGSVLSGFDPAHDRCSIGVSVLSGCMAGRSAGV